MLELGSVQRKRTLNQATVPSGPRQGAYRTAPGQRPLRGAAQALLLYYEGLTTQAGGFGRKQSRCSRNVSDCQLTKRYPVLSATSR